MAGLAIGAIKDTKAESGCVEVFELLATHDYTTFGKKERSAITLADGPNFTFNFGRPVGDWFFGAIKIRNARSGKVEVHTMPRADYQIFDLHAETRIELTDAPNFSFMLGENGDLICVKRFHTKRGKVEVHVLSWASNYQDFVAQAETPITVSDGWNFDFQVTHGNRLVCIKRHNSESESVELHFLEEDYESFSLQKKTSLPLTAAGDLSFLFEAFQFGGTIHQNLIGITWGATKSGRVDILKLEEPWDGVLKVLPSAFLVADRPNFKFAVMR